MLLGSVSVVTAALLVGCGESGGGDPSPPPPAASVAPSVAPVPTGPPAGVEAEAVTRGSGHALLTEDSVISLAFGGGDNCWLTAQKLAAPDTPAWKVKQVDGLALGCAGSPALSGSTVLLPYGKATPGAGIEAGGAEKGVLALNLDGTHRWHTAVAEVNTVLGADDSFVLAVDKRNSLPGSSEKHTTAVLDVTTGKVLWSKPGLRPVGLDNGIVIVTDEKIDKVTALDAATGDERWSSPMYARGSVGLTGAGVVAVPIPANPGDITSYDAKVELRDAGTGTVLHTEPKAAAFPACVSDGETAVVCEVRGGGKEANTIFAYDLSAKKGSWSLPPAQVKEAGVTVRSMVRGRVFVWTTTQGALVDAVTGKQVAHTLPAAPTLVRGAYGVENDADAKSFSVHRLTY
ncbi:hypothetical protein Aph02nite_22580 [Actinoplanes philippinensis]|nr:hypothetical protein Aph02nite_22580 [Actinoplanes philippinensis]